MSGPDPGGPIAEALSSALAALEQDDVVGASLAFAQAAEACARADEQRLQLDRNRVEELRGLYQRCQPHAERLRLSIADSLAGTARNRRAIDAYVR